MQNETWKKSPFRRQLSALRLKGLPALQGSIDLGIDLGQPSLHFTLGLGRALIEGRIGQPALQRRLLHFQRGDARGQLLE